MTRGSADVGSGVQRVLEDFEALVPEAGLGPQPGEGLQVGLAPPRAAMRDTAQS